MADFEVVGTIVVDDQGSVSIQNLNQGLNNLESNSASAGNAFMSLGGIAEQAFGQLIGNAIQSAASALANFTGGILRSGMDAQNAMAQFDSVLRSTATTVDVATTSQGKWEKVTGLSAKGAKALESAIQSQNNAINDLTLKEQIHGSASKAAGEAVAFHQAKIAQLTDELKKGTAVQEVWVNNVEKGVPVLRMTRDALMALADSQGRLTTFSKNENIAAETMLLQYQKIGKDVFPQAMQASADLATRMGIDLTTAAMTVGRALGDPAMGIGRLNAQFKLFEPTQLKQIENMAKAGKVAEAQTLILDALTSKLGGAATAAAGTFEGKMDIIGNRLRDFGESIMMSVLPGLGKWLDGLNPILDALPAIADVISTRVIPIIGQFFTELTNGEGIISKFVDNLVGPFKGLWDSIQPALAQLKRGVGTFMSTLMQPDLPPITVTQPVRHVKPMGKDPGEPESEETIKRAVPQKSFATKFVEAIKASLPDITAGLADLFGKIGQWITTTGLTLLQGPIQVVVDGITNALTTVSNIVTGLKIIFGEILSRVDKGTLDNVTTFFTKLGDGIKAIPSTITTIADSIKAIFLEAIGHVDKSALDSASDFLKKLGDGLRALPADLASTGKNIQALADGIKSLALDALSKIDPTSFGFLATGIALIAVTLVAAQLPTLIGAVTLALTAMSAAGVPALIAMLPLIGVIAVIAGIVYLATANVGGFGDTLKALGTILRGGDLKTGLEQIFRGTTNLMTAFLTTTPLGQWLLNIFVNMTVAVNNIKNAFQDFKDKIVTPIQDAITWIQGDGTKLAGTAFTAFASAAGSALGKIADPMINAVIDALVQLVGALYAVPGGALMVGPIQNALAQLKRRAFGGDVAEGEPYIVGEKGWEIFVPDKPGRIMSHSESVNSSAAYNTTHANRTSNVYNYNFGSQPYSPSRGGSEGAMQMFRKT